MRPDTLCLLALIAACSSPGKDSGPPGAVGAGPPPTSSGGFATASLGGSPTRASNSGGGASVPAGGVPSVPAGGVPSVPAGATSMPAEGGAPSALGSGGTQTATGARGGSGGSSAGGTENHAEGGARTSGTAGGSAEGGAAGSSSPPSSPEGGSGPMLAPFMLGADLSFVQEEEDKGITFVDDGTPKDIFQLLQDHGFNTVRLRLFHDPGAPGGYQTEFVTRAEPYCDLKHTIEMAQRVKAAGMGLLLDLHYSDTWADPDNQHKPAAWANLNFDALVKEVHDYTQGVLLALQTANALPDLVQVGNEITPGLLHPDGHTFEPNNWDQLASLLKAGLQAVKGVNADIKTILHLDRGGDNATTVWWVDEALARNVEFDILALSAYTAFHGGPSVWRANFAALATRYPKLAFMIAEYNGEQRAANDIMHELPGGRGVGTFFWEPTASGEWGDSMVTFEGNNAVFRKDVLAIYDKIADEYKLR